MPFFDPRTDSRFVNWGRQTMVSLPGLCLVTGKYGLFKAIMINYMRFVKDGLLPNYITDINEPAYNSIDASLWMFWAMGEYLSHTGDYGFLDTVIDLRVSKIKGRNNASIREVLEDIVENMRGKYMDRKDGLISAGNEYTQLTWMDVTGDKGIPVTPRYGKAVEVNALWYHALELMGTMQWKYRKAASMVKANFIKFWNADEGCLYDTIDGDDREGRRVRPNQVWAVVFGLLDEEKSRKVMSKLRDELLTAHGLRTLSPIDNGYYPQLTAQTKDLADHNGTVYPWLMGAFIAGYMSAYGAEDTIKLLQETGYLDGLDRQLSITYSVAERFNGYNELDHEYNGLGCRAEAWSVAEVLRGLSLIFPSGYKNASIVYYNRGTGIVYEMSIRDYCDPAKGISGLNAAQKELNFLAESGIEYVYLIGIMKHNGRPFEILDPFDIDERAGSFDDLDNFIHLADQLGIKVIIDWLANQHLSKASPYCKETPGQIDKWAPEMFLYTYASDGNVFKEENHGHIIRGMDIKTGHLKSCIRRGEGLIQSLRKMKDDVPREGNIVIDGEAVSFVRADIGLRDSAPNLQLDHVPVIVTSQNAFFPASATDDISLQTYLPRRWNALIQPDLSNPKLQHMAIEIGRFWLGKGLNFRIDAALSTLPDRIKSNWGIETETNLTKVFISGIRDIKPDCFIWFEGFDRQDELLRLAGNSNSITNYWQIRNSSTYAIAFPYDFQNMPDFKDRLREVSLMPKARLKSLVNLGPEHDAFDFNDPWAGLSYEDRLQLYFIYTFLPSPFLLFNGEIYGIQHNYSNNIVKSHSAPALEQAKDKAIEAGRELLSLRKYNPQLRNGEFMLIDTGDTNTIGLARFDESAAILGIVNPAMHTKFIQVQAEPFIPLLAGIGSCLIEIRSLDTETREWSIAKKTWTDVDLSTHGLSLTVNPKSCVIVRLGKEMDNGFNDRRYKLQQSSL